MQCAGSRLPNPHNGMHYFVIPRACRNHCSVQHWLFRKGRAKYGMLLRVPDRGLWHGMRMS